MRKAAVMYTSHTNMKREARFKCILELKYNFGGESGGGGGGKLTANCGSCRVARYQTDAKMARIVSISNHISE